MTDYPAIMSAAMVRAMLREVQEPGTGKTMTRRLAWTGRKAADGEGFRPSPWQRVTAGDRIYVREKLTRSGGLIQYAADTKTTHRAWPASWKQDPRPSIHMHRGMSRLTLHVTNTKIERLQDITEADAAAEGISTIERSLIRHGRLNGYGLAGITPPEEAHATRVNAFRALWVSLHGADSWNANTWVVAVSFHPVLANIDSVKEVA